MLNRSLLWRLEQLEEPVMPETVWRVWQIVCVDSDARREGEKIERRAPTPVRGKVPAFENATDNGK